MKPDKMETDKRCAWKYEGSEKFPSDASSLSEEKDQ